MSHWNCNYKFTNEDLTSSPVSFYLKLGRALYEGCDPHVLQSVVGRYNMLNTPKKKKRADGRLYADPYGIIPIETPADLKKALPRVLESNLTLEERSEAITRIRERAWELRVPISLKWKKPND